MSPRSAENQSSALVFVVIFLIVVAVVAVGIGGFAYNFLRKSDDEVNRIIESDTKPAHEVTMEPLVKREPPSEGYVGSDKCAACHSDIAEKYQTHSMAHAFGALRDVTPIEDMEHTEIAPPGPRRYRVEQQGDRVFHHEIMLDKEGRPIYDQAVEVKYALGSGKRGRAYLIFEDGEFYQSSIGWYSSAKKWDLAPGYHPQRHSRFARRLGEGCFYCHVGRSRLDSGEVKYLDPPFSEASIGCERCHGPGEAHVALREAGDLPDGTKDPIVNPVKLSPERREDVCNECHLQGDFAILRYGRRHSDFRPGDRLEDNWVIFVSGDRITPDGRTKAVSQVGQMRASACYRKSEGKFGCISCHDPHAEPVPEQRVAFYRDRCNACHEEHGCSLSEKERLAQSPEDSCIQCHMPRIPTRDVPHTAQTDHRVMRVPSFEDMESHERKTVLESRVFDGADQRLPKREVDRAKGLAILEDPSIAQRPELIALAMQLLCPVADQAPNSADVSFIKVLGDDVMALDGMGRAFQMQRDIRRAEACWSQILTIEPDNKRALWWKLVNAHEAFDLEQSAAYIDRLLAISPRDANVHGRKAHILGQLGQLRRAALSAERALELDPTLIQVREWLVEVYDKLGEEDKKQHQQDLIRRIKEVEG